MFGSSRAISVAIGALLPSLAACLVPQLGLTPLRAVSASTNRIARASGSGEGFGYGAGYDPELTAALELVEVSCRAAHSSPLSALPSPLLTTPPVRRHESRQPLGTTRRTSPPPWLAGGLPRGPRPAVRHRRGEELDRQGRHQRHGVRRLARHRRRLHRAVPAAGRSGTALPKRTQHGPTRHPRSGRASHLSARGALPPAHGGSLSLESRATAAWAPQCSPGGASPRRRPSRRLSRRAWSRRTLTLGFLTLTLGFLTLTPALTLLQDPDPDPNPECLGPQDRFIAEETSAQLLAADDATRAAVVAAYVENKAAQTSASWLSGGPFQGQIVPQGCPELRPASANQPLGPRWPAISALFST